MSIEGIKLLLTSVPRHIGYINLKAFKYLKIIYAFNQLFLNSIKMFKSSLEVKTTRRK